MFKLDKPRPSNLVNNSPNNNNMVNQLVNKVNKVNNNNSTDNLPPLLVNLPVELPPLMLMTTMMKRKALIVPP
jgi:hypothetical protein